jgi:hypothetical protein
MCEYLGCDPTTDTITIDGERIEYPIVTACGRGALIQDGSREWTVFKDSDDAGQDAREYWANMARNDPAEFALMVGESTLVSWGLGQPAGPGSYKVRSLSAWLDLWLDTPEDHHARYDGEERTVDHIGEDLCEEVGFTPTVAYRVN